MEDEVEIEDPMAAFVARSQAPAPAPVAPAPVAPAPVAPGSGGSGSGGSSSKETKVHCPGNEWDHTYVTRDHSGTGRPHW